jgi:hypothetical protein
MEASNPVKKMVAPTPTYLDFSVGARLINENDAPEQYIKNDSTFFITHTRT